MLPDPSDEALNQLSLRYLFLVALCPCPEVVAEREPARPKNGYGTQKQRI